jgi:hypothetical protein
MDFTHLDLKPTKVEFMDLPTEIHIAIINQLSCPGRPCLKYTNRYFFELVPLPSHAELLAAEDPIYDGEDPNTLKFLACRDCVRLRPSYKFADKMRKGRLGGRRSHAFKRICLDSFLNPKPGKPRDAKGSYVKIMGEIFVLCRECMRFERVPSDQRDKRRCGGCVEKERVFLRGVAMRTPEPFQRPQAQREADHRPLKRSWILSINRAVMKILGVKGGE